MPSFAVIGASRGVGLELVRQLSANSANTVVVTVRNKEKPTYLKDLVQRSENNNVYVIEADVVDQHAMELAAAEATKITGGALDVLVYNAARMEAENMVKGFLDYETPEKLDEEFIASFKVNVLGVVHAVNAFLPLLRKGTAKKIITIGSEGGDSSLVWKMRLAKAAAYGTTKAAENMVATKYAAELENEGFTVVSVSPGMVDVSATGSGYSVPPEELMPTVNKIMNGIYAAFPKATMITPEESCRRLVSFIDSAGPADSGIFHPSTEYIY
ncbi:NAD-P-binding protein [Fomitopsis serialis]|uniref:NAD-P-binding protein n=1 Tax=Fomitopsis serialis TaxID=139415 RepID=UPI002008582E|nr:NAD-P-binding protein [Neoantrodia serialis]KAH9929440.1 NAD-P-binding protein [Neoantrodia serialis]